MAVNFTPEHKKSLEDLAVKRLFDNKVITNAFGSPLSVSDLIHNETLNSLKSLHRNLKKQLENLEGDDSWSVTEAQSLKIASLKEDVEFLNLLIGYKYWKSEEASKERKKANLETEINALKESMKSPEDRLKEMEEKLKSLN